MHVDVSFGEHVAYMVQTDWDYIALFNTTLRKVSKIVNFAKF